MTSIECATRLDCNEDTKRLTNPTERAFALRCIAVGCIVFHEVRIGSSLIDFLVINPRINRTGEHTGILVEVTRMRKAQKDVKAVRCPGKNNRKKRPNLTGKRKNRQIEAMAASGLRWTILYGENLDSINRSWPTTR